MTRLPMIDVLGPSFVFSVTLIETRGGATILTLVSATLPSPVHSGFA